MKIKNLIIASALTAALGAMGSCSSASDADKATAEMNSFIDELMAKMTLEEKLGQLNLPGADDIVTGQAKSSNIGAMVANGQVGGVFNIKGVEKIRELQRIAVEDSRLGIPLLFGMDVIHGYETVFPIPLGLSCTWDTTAIEESARIAAKEASASGICWTFSPMVDISRDPRWGRMSEGSGEDPFLGAAITRAMVHGYQGDNTFSGNDRIMACVKHFALYGAPEGGRDYNTVDMSLQRMYNEYFAPYKAGVEAGAGSFMASFNTINGVPATGNKWLLTDVLRDQWGFDGFVVTDYTAIMEMTDHGMGDLQQCSAMALKAGIDMDMVADGFIGTLKKSLDDKLVNMDDINKAVRRILEAKYKLGLFKDPYKYADPERAKTDVFTAEHRATARRIAAESFVLLKNEGNILPLKKQGKIAVVGPLANTSSNMPGTWSVAVNLEEPKPLIQGIIDAVGSDAQVVYAKGCNITGDPELEANATMFGRDIRDSRSDKELLDEALRIARSADVIVAAMGESSEFSGESSSRSDIALPDVQIELLKALVALGKPVVMLNFSGRPTVMTWESENVPAIMNVWFGGTEAADAIADVIFGDVSPSGKLTASMPRSVGQLPVNYNHYNTGRPKSDDSKFEKFRSGYIDLPNSPLYPFGYGLSYTTFDYSNFKLSANEMDTNGKITASVTVKNTGNVDADEIVQLYIRDLVGSISRPVKELKGFSRISLKAGESKNVTFDITPELLKFYNSDLEFVCEPGEFQVMVGPDSQQVSTLSFTLK